MLIGIKYCGGCNSEYQRGAAVKKLKAEFPEHEYAVAAAGKDYDLGLAVCGCGRACVDGAVFSNSQKRMFLTSESDFEGVAQYLRSSAKAGKVQAIERKCIHIGDRASYRKTFYRDDAERFAILTGDRNRLHLEESFASACVFQRPVLHGVLVSSLMSTVMGMELPGEGTVLMEEDIKFRKPVFYGDTITAEVVLRRAEDKGGFYMGYLEGICKNQEEAIVAKGDFCQMMDKQLFFVKEQEEEDE